MENAKAIDTDKYTDETVKVFKESLSIAEDVLADEEATEAEVSEAVARLANAIEQLEEKDTPTDPDDGDKPDDGNKPDDENTPGGGNQSGNGSDGSNAPKTGDTSNIFGVLAVLTISAAAGAGAVYSKRKKS